MATENDIVLVYMEGSPVFFARIEAIWADVKRDWFNVELLVLQVPVKVVVWTLKDIYINGTEFFMGGKRMRIEVVNAPHQNFITDNDDDEEAALQEPVTHLKSVKKIKPEPEEEKESGRVISIADFQKKKKDNQPD
ncbi:MAG: hypothetical protein HQK72_07060 [Desulfamplus sp.]|nr:hypothetical protein [Desulfamplus sp.]